MTALILDKDILKMLTTAHEITANQSGDRHYLTIYPKSGNYQHKTELPLEMPEAEPLPSRMLVDGWVLSALLICDTKFGV